MIAIDITSDIEQQLRGVEQFAARLEGTFAFALDATAGTVREEIAFHTWPSSIGTRNRAFGNWVFKVLKRAKKGDLLAVVGQRQNGKDYRDWLIWQADGDTKVPLRHRQIAIPVNPASVRNPQGSVKNVLKPKNITSKKKNTFVIGKGDNKRAIVQRQRGKDGKLKTIYIFKTAAPIKKAFPFYEDALHVAERQFPFHAIVKFRQIVARSPFE